MENASKALIIAGSIIISLVIVGLGVIVYRNVSGTITGANFDQQQAEAHNSAFVTYFGTRKTANDVKSLLSAITSNNTSASTNDSDNERVYVEYYEGSTKKADNKTAISAVTKLIKQGTTYTVEIYNDNTSDGDSLTDGSSITGYYKNGYVKAVKITKNSTSNS